jgi:hypothetical protein
MHKQVNSEINKTRSINKKTKKAKKSMRISKRRTKILRGGQPEWNPSYLNENECISVTNVDKQSPNAFFPAKIVKQLPNTRWTVEYTNHDNKVVNKTVSRDFIHVNLRWLDEHMNHFTNLEKRIENIENNTHVKPQTPQTPPKHQTPKHHHKHQTPQTPNTTKTPNTKTPNTNI